MKVGEYNVEFEELKLPELSEIERTILKQFGDWAKEKDYFNSEAYRKTVEKKLNNLFISEYNKHTILKKVYVKNVSKEAYSITVDLAYETKCVADQPKLVEFINKIIARRHRNEMRRETKIGRFRYKNVHR